MNRNIKTTAIVLKGGLNQASSVLEMQPGEATQLFNYEVNTLGRYQRVLGYERFDGRPAPSAAVPSGLAGYPFSSDEDEQSALLAERTSRRLAIGPVPGDGPIRGIATYKGVTYAFRDNAQGTACVMWRSSDQGWQEVPTPSLSPGGRFEFSVANFGASSQTIKLYGVDGKNPLFEFDGSSFEQIQGPIEGKHPTHLEVLSSQIMALSYEGGTFVLSDIGDPRTWAAEFGVSDEITALDLQANNSLAVFCRNRTFVLYGTSTADFSLQDLSKTTGANEWTVQTIGDSIYIDDRGMTRLDRVQQFGNFDMATVSQKVEPLLQRYMRRAIASFSIREKNQYRVCFDDGTGLICTFFGREVAGFSTFDYGKVIRTTWSGEDQTGLEVVYFGSDDGYVYQAEKGFSFDGEPIPHVCRPAFAHFGAPEVKKRWRKVVVEADTVGKATFNIVPEFDYSDPSVPYHPAIEIVATGGGGYWDEGAWDETVWSAASTFTADAYVDGVSRNLSLAFSGETTGEAPHILNSYIIHYSPRGRRR